MGPAPQITRVAVLEGDERGQGGGPGRAPLVQQGRRLGCVHGRFWAPVSEDLVASSRQRQRRRPFAHGEVLDLIGDGPTRGRGAPSPFGCRERCQQTVERGLFVGQIGEEERIDGLDGNCGSA